MNYNGETTVYSPMKLSLPLALLGTLFFLSACEDEPPVTTTRRRPATYQQAPSQAQYPPPPQPYDPNLAPPSPPDVAVREEVAPQQPPSAPAAQVKPTRGDIQYGIPVPNKPGFVTSPFAPNQGYVDVRGFPPGTEVKDPYTGKIFLVP